MKETEEIVELFCFRKVLKVSSEGKCEADLLEALQDLVNLDIEASFIKGKVGEELKAVKVEYID